MLKWTPQRSKKYASLSFSGADGPMAGGKKIVIVEEFPYIGKPEYKAEFLSIMRAILDSCRFLVVFMVTDHHERRCAFS